MITGVDVIGQNVFYVLPSSTGNKGAEINAAIVQANASVTAPGRAYVKLTQGTYLVETAILPLSNVELIGEGPGTRLVANGITGSADDSSNAMVKVLGALNTASLNTTLSVLASKDATTATVAAGGSIGDTDWVYLEGRNATSNSSGDTDGANVLLKETIQLSDITGTALTFATPLQQYHAATNTTVKGVGPVLNCAIRNLDVSAEGGSVAVGILSRYNVGLELEGISGAGFSRGLIDLEGTKNAKLKRIHSRGEVNSIVFLDSAQCVDMEGVTSSPVGTRYHASGIPRGMIEMRNRCTHINGGSPSLNRGVVAINSRGGKHISFGDVVISDMDSDRANTQWQTVSEGGGAVVIGAGLCLRGGAEPNSENIHAMSFDSVTISNCRHEAQGVSGCSVLLEDAEVYIGRLAIRNTGDVESWMSGVTVSDGGGYIGNYYAQGISNALVCQNATANVDIGLMAYDGTPGSGVNPQSYALTLSYASPGGAPRIRVFGPGNASRYVVFGAGFADPKLVIERYFAEGIGEYGRMIMAINNTGSTVSVGDVVEFSGSITHNSQSFPAVITPTGAKRTQAVVAIGANVDTGTNGSPIMVCPLPDARSAFVTVRAADTAAVGELIEGQNASRESAKNNSSTAPLGKVIGSPKTGTAAVAKVQIAIA